MTLDMGNTDKLAEFRAEAERLGIKVEPPAINRSGVEFDVDGNAIRYALAALPAGGFDALEPNRARVVAAVDAIMATAQRAHDDAAAGQSELFNGGATVEPLAL